MQKILVIDAGGTSTRAITLDHAGRCLGYGRGAGGNPTGSGVDSAISELLGAAGRALAADGSPTDPGSSVVVALAGIRPPGFLDRLTAGFRGLGFEGDVVVDSDLLATYFSGTFEPEGCVLIAGTGAISARVTGGRLDVIKGGSGWLLGDDGSGFWLGLRVVRAAVAALDDIGPPTALADLLLDELGIDVSGDHSDERPPGLRRLVEALYSMKPVELARFAPLAFAAGDDAVAAGLLADGATALAELLAAVHDAGRAGPVILGGGVLAAWITTPGAELEGRLSEAVGDAHLSVVTDGAVGAAVLGLRHAGVMIDAERFARLQGEVDRIRSR